MSNELGLRLDVKYNRIYIHRATLKAIGNPEFVALGIHSQSRKLVVLPSVADASDSIRVRYAEENPCCIHSKEKSKDAMLMRANQNDTQIGSKM